MHRDANNEGPSFIKAFGDFKGGQLNYWGDDNKAEGSVETCCEAKDKVTMDISKQLLLFDGNRGHSVENFKGNRYSLVYFKADKRIREEYLTPSSRKPTSEYSSRPFSEYSSRPFSRPCTGQFFKADKRIREELARCGFHFPTKEGLEIAKGLLGKPRGYKALKKTKGAIVSTKPTAITWPQDPHKKHAVNFLSKQMQEKARLAVKDLCVGAVANQCKDTKFTGYKIAYETLPDKRRRCNIFMIGVSGGRLFL